MPERLQQPNDSGWRTARRRTPRIHARAVSGRRAVRAGRSPDNATGTGPTILGFPAEVERRDDDERPPADAPADVDLTDQVLVVHRRPDLGGGAALVLSGLAANLSLFLPWSAGEEAPNGLSLVDLGADVFGSGLGTLARSDVWQPLAVVVSGGLLVLLGFLLFIPARAHRLVGVLALIVSLAAAASVVVLLADAGWDPDRLGVGMWCAAAVAVLGLVGALQAMLTAPQVTVEPTEEVAAPEL